MRIEILHVRAPDETCEHVVFVDGKVETSVEIADVDAGRGYSREDWDEHTEWVREHSGYTNAFTAAVIANREEPPGSEFIA